MKLETTEGRECVQERLRFLQIVIDNYLLRNVILGSRDIQNNQG